MPLKIIDSSTLPLNLENHQWAEFRKTKSGVKLHLRLVFMDKGLSYPDQAVITNAKEHDRGQLEVLVDDQDRSEEHTSELQSRGHLVCRLLLEKKKKIRRKYTSENTNKDTISVADR